MDEQEAAKESNWLVLAVGLTACLHISEDVGHSVLQHVIHDALKQLNNVLKHRAVQGRQVFNLRALQTTTVK